MDLSDSLPWRCTHELCTPWQTGTPAASTRQSPFPTLLTTYQRTSHTFVAFRSFPYLRFPTFSASRFSPPPTPLNATITTTTTQSRRKTNTTPKGQGWSDHPAQVFQKRARRELVAGLSRNTSGDSSPACSWDHERRSIACLIPDPCRAPSLTETLELSVQRSRVLKPGLGRIGRLTSTGQRPIVPGSQRCRPRSRCDDSGPLSSATALCP